MYIDRDSAEKAVIEISKFLRSTMEERASVTLKEELQMVRRYIYIENIRFIDHIKLSENIPDQLLSTTIPKFSVQLLVENAIKHGKVSGDRDFYIDIEAKESDSNIISIVVSNSGEINKRVVFGTGLKNLEERLKYISNGEVKFMGNKNGKIYFQIEVKRG
jgi:LytS/YehU family sensor histidine kinase